MTEPTEAQIKKIISENASKNGTKGGSTTKERYGREHFVNIARGKKGQTWTWDPAKKGPRKNKVATYLQKDVMSDIIPPTVGMTEVINK